MIWYPYEQMKTMKEPYRILDAEGVHLYTKDQKLIDSISSWWCMIHGYKHPELTAAIKEQADRFCHVMLGGLTHEPVEKLSDKLQEFLPEAYLLYFPTYFLSARSLERPFYLALKMISFSWTSPSLSFAVCSMYSSVPT